MTETVEIQRLVDNLTKFVNSYTPASDEFISIMECEHRTLQQQFTRLVFLWIQHCASIDYRYDDRNRATHETCRKLLDAFRKETGNIDPSNFLPFI